jgi:hypothetical protein
MTPCTLYSYTSTLSTVVVVLVVLFPGGSQSILCAQDSIVGECCKEENSHKYDYEMRCPPTYETFSFGVKEGEAADLRCAGGTKYTDILQIWNPGLFKIGNVTQFSIQSCPLPESNLLEFIQNIFGATGVKVLKIRSATGTLSRFHLANLTQLSYLDMTEMSSDPMDASFFQDLPNLAHLYIKSFHKRNGFSLSKDTFNGLNKLKVLELDNNGLQELSSDQFTGLAGLQKLNLHNNRLTQLPAGLFAGLANLTSLTLSENKLTSLPAGIFDPLVSLEVVNLGENYYEQLPENLFIKTTSLKTIDMTLNNHICSYSGADFQPSKYYKKRSLDYCIDKVKKIDLPNTLFQIPSLQSLKMLHFYVNSFPEDIFKGAVKLENVTIQTTFSGNFPAKIFRDAKNMSNLDLAGNQISWLPPGLFAGMSRLASSGFNSS